MTLREIQKLLETFDDDVRSEIIEDELLVSSRNFIFTVYEELTKNNKHKVLWTQRDWYLNHPNDYDFYVMDLLEHKLNCDMDNVVYGIITTCREELDGRGDY